MTEKEKTRKTTQVDTDIAPYFTEREAGITKVRSIRGQRAPKLPQTRLVEGGTYKIVNGKLELVNAPKTPKTLHLRPGLFYRSADGRKIQVWAINKNSTGYPIIGMIETEGEWRPMIWNDKGVTKRPYGVVNDIVAPWSQS